MTVAIAGAGIAGLTLGLTLHQIGAPFRIYEAVRQLKPLGVGINLQPNAVRELIDLGLKDDLARIGVATQSLGFYSKTGREIWTEQRGIAAGYHWPQVSVHRGHLQMLLYHTLIARAGEGCVVTGHRATGFSEARLKLETTDGPVDTDAKLIIAADGIHSALRHQMYPHEGAPIWGGAVLWRGTTQAAPFLSGADMIMAGHDSQRLVAYPITPPDTDTGQAMINWIAELRIDPAQGWRKEDWNRRADLADFLPSFYGWRFDWLDIPTLIKGAEAVYEYPMVDREPVEKWTEGPVTLIGDAAHPTYPVGSNGASQAIVDARTLGACVSKHGTTANALLAYETAIRPRTTAVTLANRGAGPDAILQLVEDRCGGEFDDIETVVPRADLAAHSAKYKSLAGFDVATLNAQPPLIGPV